MAVPVDLECGICLNLAKNPVHSGKLFCMECLEKYGTEKPYPNCSGDKKKMKCFNLERGCKWEGAAIMLDDHTLMCEFALLPCPKQCNVYLLSKDLDDHLSKVCPNRDHKCEHCGEKGTFASIQVHDGTCFKKILKCPNSECSSVMLRQDIDDHVQKKCEHTILTCPYSAAGCNFQSKRGAMLKHEDDSLLHLSKAMEMIVKLNDTQAKLQEKMDVFKKLAWPETDAAGFSISFELTEYEMKRNSNRKYFFPFHTSPKGYSMAICVYTNGDEYIDMIFGDKEYNEHYDSPWHDPEKECECCRDSDEEEDNESDGGYEESFADEEYENDESGMECEEECHGKGEVAVLSKEATDCKQGGYEVAALPKEASGGSNCKQEGKRLTIETLSDSEDEEMECDGDNDPTHLSVVAMVLDGGTDVQMPFSGHITITLLNYLANKNHICKLFTFTFRDNTTSGNVKWISHFIGHSELLKNPFRNTQYLMDDTLRFRVSVQCSGMDYAAYMAAASATS